MTETLQPLDHYPDFVGPLNDQRIVGAIKTYLDTNKLPMPDVKEKTGYEPQLVAINETLIELGQDMGVDVSSRLREPDYTHIYPSDSYDAVNAHFGRPEVSIGTRSITGHIFAAAGSDIMATLRTISHESVHRVQRESINPTYCDTGIDIGQGTHHHGFANERTGAFNGLDESLVEMTNIDLIRNYWTRHPELPDVTETPYENVGYESSVLLMDAIIAKAPEPKQLFKNLQRGMIVGDMPALRKLMPIVGQEGMKKLASMDAYSDADVRRVAVELGFEDVAKKIDEQDTSELMKWL